MRKGWIETTLGEIADYINGYPFKPDDLGDQGLPVIRIKQLLDPEEQLDRSLVKVPERCVLNDGDVVFSWSGTLAVRVWNRGPALLNQHLFRVIEKPGVIKEWLPLVIDHAIEELGEKSHGTTMKHITKSTLLPHAVTLPPIDIQKRIVDLMSAVDEYIAALQRQADAARTARNAVLHELLTTGGDDWVETTLGEVITLEYGKPLKAESRDGKGFPVFGSAGEVGYHSDPLVNQAPVIIVGRKGTAGAVWWSDVPCSVIDTAYYVVPKCDSDLRFLYFILEFLNLPSLNAQTGVPGLNRDRAYSSQVLMPPLETQRRIVEIVSSVDDLIHETETAINESKALRSGLLSDLLSGHHGIPDSYDRLLGAA